MSLVPKSPKCEYNRLTGASPTDMIKITACSLILRENQSWESSPCALRLHKMPWCVGLRPERAGGAHNALPAAACVVSAPRVSSQFCRRAISYLRLSCQHLRNNKRSTLSSPWRQFAACQTISAGWSLPQAPKGLPAMHVIAYHYTVKQKLHRF